MLRDRYFRGEMDKCKDPEKGTCMYGFEEAQQNCVVFDGFLENKFRIFLGKSFAEFA